MGEIIEIVGLDNFPENDQIKVKGEIMGLFNKLKTHAHVGGISKAKVFIKEYDNGGSRKQYSIKLDIRLESRTFEADSEDWFFSVALKKAFRKIGEEMEHEFHNKGFDKH